MARRQDRDPLSLGRSGDDCGSLRCRKNNIQAALIEHMLAGFTLLSPLVIIPVGV
jgi:hypothetical protein